MTISIEESGEVQLKITSRVGTKIRTESSTRLTKAEHDESHRRLYYGYVYNQQRYSSPRRSHIVLKIIIYYINKNNRRKAECDVMKIEKMRDRDKGKGEPSVGIVRGV